MIWIIILLVLAAVFGVGAVVEGILWLLLITVLLVVGAIALGMSLLRR